MTIRAHRDAVITELLKTLTNSVFKSYSAADTERYAVVFVARTSKQQSRYAALPTRDVFTVTVHSVGVDEDSCLWVQERVDALAGKTLTVTGRSLWPAEYITGRPPDLDDDGPSPLWFSVSQFDIISDPS